MNELKKLEFRASPASQVRGRILVAHPQLLHPLLLDAPQHRVGQQALVEVHDRVPVGRVDAALRALRALQHAHPVLLGDRQVLAHPEQVVAQLGALRRQPLRADQHDREQDEADDRQPHEQRDRPGVGDVVPERVDPDRDEQQQRPARDAAQDLRQPVAGQHLVALLVGVSRRLGGEVEQGRAGRCAERPGVDLLADPEPRAEDQREHLELALRRGARVEQLELVTVLEGGRARLRLLVDDADDAAHREVDEERAQTPVRAAEDLGGYQHVRLRRVVLGDDEAGSRAAPQGGADDDAGDDQRRDQIRRSPSATIWTIQLSCGRTRCTTVPPSNAIDDGHGRVRVHRRHRHLEAVIDRGAGRIRRPSRRCRYSRRCCPRAHRSGRG